MGNMVKTVAMYLCLLCGAVQITWAQSYDEYWKEIEKAQRAALPQTVLKLTEEVRKKALKEHKIPQERKKNKREFFTEPPFNSYIC